MGEELESVQTRHTQSHCQAGGILPCIKASWWNLQGPDFISTVSKRCIPLEGGMKESQQSRWLWDC